MNKAEDNVIAVQQVDPPGYSGGAPGYVESRQKIFVREVAGRFQRLGAITIWPLLVAYFGVAWLPWGERQAVLFDLPARQFHVFGTTFWPQDFWLLGWALIISALALFTFTTVVGRLWCGYSCPQTVWTRIFIAIEEFTEGARHRRIRLQNAPPGIDKIARQTAKHVLWLVVAGATGLTFVGYFTPIRELLPDMLALQAHGWAWFWVAFFTLATYANAGWLREKVCVYMCPYARFQSAMIDSDTLIVSYDAARGEPRGAARKKQSANMPVATPAGDCVDCQMCVQVCPTGIDIRDGLQYACIGCARCIDACDSVMEQVGRAPGLVRYTTQTALLGGAARWFFKPRALGYALALVVMGGLFATALFNRSLFELNVLRPRGELFQLVQISGQDAVQNSYRLTLLNKAQAPLTLQLHVDSVFPVAAKGQTAWTLEPGEVLDVPLVLQGQPVAQLAHVQLQLCNTRTQQCVSERAPFIGPSVTSPSAASPSAQGGLVAIAPAGPLS